MKIGQMWFGGVVLYLGIMVFSHYSYSMESDCEDSTCARYDETSPCDQKAIVEWLKGLKISLDNPDDGTEVPLPLSIKQRTLQQIPYTSSWNFDLDRGPCVEELDELLREQNYSQLVETFKKVDWDNKDVLSWLIAQAKSGSVICAYYAVGLEIRRCQKEAESAYASCYKPADAPYRLSAQFKSLVKHILFLLMLVQVDIARYWFMSSKNLVERQNLHYIYLDIKQKILVLIRRSSLFEQMLKALFEKWAREEKLIGLGFLLDEALRDLKQVEACVSLKWVQLYEVDRADREEFSNHLKFGTSCQEAFWEPGCFPYNIIVDRLGNFLKSFKTASSKVITLTSFFSGNYDESARTTTLCAVFMPYKPTYFSSSASSRGVSLSSGHVTPQLSPNGHGTPPPLPLSAAVDDDDGDAGLAEAWYGQELERTKSAEE